MANRVAEILAISESFKWMYVNMSSNPAASRGAKVNMFLKSKAWLLEPSFLMEPEESWASLGTSPLGLG